MRLLTFTLLEGLHRECVEFVGDNDKLLSCQAACQSLEAHLQTYLLALGNKRPHLSRQIVLSELEQSVLDLLDLVICLVQEGRECCGWWWYLRLALRG